MKTLLELFRFLQAYAVITISGGFPERFLNLCNREKVYLWDVVYENNCVKAKIYCKDFSKLRGIRKKCGVKIKITGKHGPGYIIKANKNRKALLAGMVTALIFMLLMNQYVWFIDVNGNESINKYEITDAANLLGLKRGTFAPTFDKNAAGRKIVNLFDGRLLWAAVNIKGSRAVIELREYKENNKEAEEKKPCNIIADFDGVIITNEVYSGTSCTARGSAVRSGDILISGISEDTDGLASFHAADGKLSAYHKRNISFAAKSTDYVRLKQKSKYKILNIFSMNFPLSLKAFDKGNEAYSYEEYINYDNTSLPFGVITKAHIQAKQTDEIITDSIILLDEFTKQEYETMKNTLIINSSYKLNNSSEGFNINAEYECIDFIGKKSDILQEN